VEQYARYRAPAESGQKLVSPSWDKLKPMLVEAQQWRRHADLEVLGQALPDFAAGARHEVVHRATAYVASYHSGGGAR
jgi:hypothetical protein